MKSHASYPLHSRQLATSPGGNVSRQVFGSVCTKAGAGLSHPPLLGIFEGHRHPGLQLLLQCGELDVNLFCTDRPRNGQPGTRNSEYISPFADQASVLLGRTPLECYADFMHAFREAFLDDIGLAIHEIAVGGGPCGELRYPSYVETQGWRFPGVGVSCACPTTRHLLLMPHTSNVSDL